MTLSCDANQGQMSTCRKGSLFQMVRRNNLFAQYKRIVIFCVYDVTVRRYHVTIAGHALLQSDSCSDEFVSL